MPKCDLCGENNRVIEKDGGFYCSSFQDYDYKYHQMPCQYTKDPNNCKCSYCGEKGTFDEWYGNSKAGEVHNICQSCSSIEDDIFVKCRFCNKATEGQIMCNPCSLVYYNIKARNSWD